MSKYDPNLGTDRDKVRFLVGDTDDDNIMLSDSEIAYLLSLEGNDVFGTASRACESIAAMFAREVDTRFSTLWQDASQAFEHYTRLSARLAVQAGRSDVAPEFLYANIDPDSPAVFWVGMHDNPVPEKDPDV
jgi:hypothetical protein